VFRALIIAAVLVGAQLGGAAVANSGHPVMDRLGRGLGHGLHSVGRGLHHMGHKMSYAAHRHGHRHPHH
jgi:hypothetical protein